MIANLVAQLRPAASAPAVICLAWPQVAQAQDAGTDAGGLHPLAAAFVGLAFAYPVLWKGIKLLWGSLAGGHRRGRDG